MNRVACTKGVWTKVLTNVTSALFSLQNYPDTSQKSGYKIHWNATGTGAPAIDVEAFNYYELDSKNVVYALPITFSNSAAQDVYIMPVFEDGAITY